MDLVSEGIHTVRARTWTFTHTKDGKLFFKANCMTEGGPPGMEAGRVSWSMFFEGRQAEVSLRALRELGWEGEHPEECHDNGGNLDRTPVRVVVLHRRFSDNTIAVVDRILFPDEEMRQELADFFRGMKIPPPRQPRGSRGAGSSSGNNI